VTQPETEPTRLVLVGRRFQSSKTVIDWATWYEPLDKVVATLTERQKDNRPGTGFEVIEVTVERRVEIGSEVTVVAEASS
jgi:hypothetical protein